MKWVAPTTLLVIALAACTTVLFVDALKPTSTGAFLFFATWLVLPYAIMGAALVFLRRKGAVSFRGHVVAVVVSAGGILFLADAIFWHPDAQGALAVLMTPIFQGVAVALLLIVASWIARADRPNR